MNLAQLNPWWSNPEAIKADSKIKEFDLRKYKYFPPFLGLTFKPGNLYSLRGPRQLGKTTAIKLIIKKLLLEQKTDPLAVFFWSCEDIADFNHLVQLIQEYLEIKKEKEISPAYIFLDEISFVQEWQRGIKLLVDRGFLKDCCVVITGSNVIDIKTSFERLPGRKGPESQDFVLLPLCFREFCSLLDFNPSIQSQADLKIHQEKIEELFRKYLQTGGFPLVINEVLEKKMAPTWLKEIYYNWIIGDLLRLGKSEKVARQIISSLLRKQPSALSWDALAKDAEVKSHLTISSYLEALESMFVIKIDYFYDLERKMPNPNKNKKIHFLDNFIYRILAETVKQEPKPEVISEDLVCFHLIKNFSEVFYTSRKKEVDFLVFIKDQPLGIEIKSQEKISSADFDSLLPFERGFLVTKKHFEAHAIRGKKYLALPLSSFIYLNQNEFKNLL